MATDEILRDEIGADAKKYLPAFIFFCSLALDAATKWLALGGMAAAPAGGRAGFFSLGLHFNYGISFSLLKSSPNATLAASLIGICVLGAACCRSKGIRLAPGTAFLWAGAVGNLADRLTRGYVVDWFYAGVYLNLADAWLCVGVLLLAKQFFHRQGG
ncbi:MAG: signal peptidase II [Synergistaceae bacterium]|jgi:signal peptidase II|nr:signal peptidase II [Synergistaceae bacterium]